MTKVDELRKVRQELECCYQTLNSNDFCDDYAYNDRFREIGNEIATIELMLGKALDEEKKMVISRFVHEIMPTIFMTEFCNANPDFNAGRIISICVSPDVALRSEEFANFTSELVDNGKISEYTCDEITLPRDVENAQQLIR